MRPNNLAEARDPLREITYKLWNCASLANVIDQSFNGAVSLDEKDLSAIAMILAETLQIIKKEIGEVRYGMFGIDE